VKIESAREEIQSLVSNSVELGNQNSDLHQQLQLQKQALENDKELLQQTITDLQVQLAQASSHQESIRENYERQNASFRELEESRDRAVIEQGKALEASRNIQEKLKEKELEIKALKIGTDTANDKLAAAELAKGRMEAALQKEISDLKSR
jgi:hypothetical protein